jgi:hypothetical protein
MMTSPFADEASLMLEYAGNSLKIFKSMYGCKPQYKLSNRRIKDTNEVHKEPIGNR